MDVKFDCKSFEELYNDIGRLKNIIEDQENKICELNYKLSCEKNKEICF